MVDFDPDPGFAQVEKKLFEITGRLSAADTLAINEALKGATPEIICRVMDEKAAKFVPKYEGHKISSFAYFVPAIREEVAGNGKHGKRRMGSRSHSARNDIAAGNADYAGLVLR